MKRLLSISFIALLSFLLSSCGDGKTTSGVDDQTTAVVAQSSSAADGPSLPEGAESVTDALLQKGIPSQCSKKFKSGKYTGLAIHKALARNDNTSRLYASWQYPSAAAVKKIVLDRCKLKEGSTCRLIDVDGKQCGGKTSDSGTGTLKITSPNGGQKLTIGKKYTIKWSKGNGGSYVKIELLKSGKGYKAIHKKTKNDGRYRWKIPGSVAAGSQYKIKITSISKKNVSDTSDTTFTISKTSSSGGSKDYKYLQKYNAYLYDHTNRFPSRVIEVSGAKSAKWKAAVNRWKPTVRFRFRSKRATNGIHIVYRKLPGNVCGRATRTIETLSGEVKSCLIQLDSEGRCMARQELHLTHEVGHCLGFGGHTKDGALMEASGSDNNGSITAAVRNMIKLLYSLVPGTNLKSYL